MNTVKVIKKEIVITILSLLILICFFGYFTYAYYTDTKESKTSVINYGDLSLEFCANSTCGSLISNIGRTIGRDSDGNINLLMPKSENEALEDMPYIFKVTNTGNYPLKVAVKLTKDSAPSINSSMSDYSPIDDEYISVAFGEQGLKPDVIAFNEITEDTIGYFHINVGESRIFNLWTWVIENAPNSVQKSYFIANISLTGEYVIPWYEKCTDNSSSACTIINAETPMSDSSLNFSQNSNESGDSGLYYTENASSYGEDESRIYYYRGDVDNNWASFGGYYWRIVRTTSEGGIKLAYSGGNTITGVNSLNTTSAITTSANFNENIESSKLCMYANDTQSQNSYIKTAIDTWYANSTLTTSDKTFLSTSAIYCNDITDEVSEKYAAYNRLSVNDRPSFACKHQKDRYSIDNVYGNGKLSNPVATLTADELYFAGLTYTSDNSVTDNTTSYIMDNITGSEYWWTMTPFEYNSFINETPPTREFNNSYHYMLSVNSNGYLNSRDVVGPLKSPGAAQEYDDVRVAVSLKSCISITSGNGTTSSPYTFSNANCS